MLTDLQKQKFTLNFRRNDANNNGYLELNDYLHLVDEIAKLKNLSHDSAEYQEMHAYEVTMWEKNVQPHADSNNDGKVSLDEYLAFCEAMLPAVTEMAKTNQANAISTNLFKMMDADNNGWVSAKEWGQYTQVWGIKEDATAHFNRLDVNGDGKLTLDEIMALYYQFVLSDDPSEPGNHLFGTLS